VTYVLELHERNIGRQTSAGLFSWTIRVNYLRKNKNQCVRRLFDVRQPNNNNNTNCTRNAPLKKSRVCKLKASNVHTTRLLLSSLYHDAPLIVYRRTRFWARACLRRTRAYVHKCCVLTDRRRRRGLVGGGGVKDDNILL